MKVSIYQKLSRVLVIWMTTVGILTYLFLLIDFILCCQDERFYGNIFNHISEYLFPLGYTFFYLVFGMMFVGVDTPQEYASLEVKEIIIISAIILIVILLMTGFYVLQAKFCKKGARACLGITLGLTIIDTIRFIIFLIGIIASENNAVILGESVLGLLLHSALIFCLIMSLRFTWKEYEHY